MEAGGRGGGKTIFLFTSTRQVPAQSEDQPCDHRPLLVTRIGNATFSGCQEGQSVSLAINHIVEEE